VHERYYKLYTINIFYMRAYVHEDMYGIAKGQIDSMELYK